VQSDAIGKHVVHLVLGRLVAVEKDNSECRAVRLEQLRRVREVDLDRRGLHSRHREVEQEGSGHRGAKPWPRQKQKKKGDQRREGQVRTPRRKKSEEGTKKQTKQTEFARKQKEPENKGASPHHPSSSTDVFRMNRRSTEKEEENVPSTKTKGRKKEEKASQSEDKCWPHFSLVVALPE
jgi:hypothetical protein